MRPCLLGMVCGEACRLVQHPRRCGLVVVFDLRPLNPIGPDNTALRLGIATPPSNPPWNSFWVPCICSKCARPLKALPHHCHCRRHIVFLGVRVELRSFGGGAIGAAFVAVRMLNPMLYFSLNIFNCTIRYVCSFLSLREQDR